MALLISIEGIDGSGKGTQAARLVERLQAKGFTAALASFPRYEETFFGKRVAEFLNGKFGSLEEVQPLFAALLYAGDRFESKKWLQDLRSKHEVVVLDRYVPSNLAHQGAKRSGEEREQLLEWISHIEYDLFGMPRPDGVIWLDVPPETAQQMVATKEPRAYTDEKADLQEADADHLARARDVYQFLAATEGGWSTIQCFQEGKMRGVENIGAEVATEVLARLTNTP